MASFPDIMTPSLFLAAVLMTSLVVSSVATTSGDDIISTVTQFESDYPVGDARWCIDRARKTNFDLTRLEVLPGIGWDNLRNVEAGMVASFNFSQCKVTDDGRLLIPDSVFTVPLKTSEVNSFAEIIDSWQNTSSMTSHSVNVQAGLQVPRFAASGSFSYEHEHLKTRQVEGKSVTVRVQLRYNRYEVKLQPDIQLSPGFKSRLLSMAADIQLDNLKQARYDAQLLVRDYGTHYLTSVTAGAALAKDDYLKKDYVASTDEQKTSTMTTASASFMSLFHMSASYGYKSDSQTNKSYLDHMTNSHIWSHGGPMLGAEPSTDKWLAGVDSNLVPIDRAGEPLSFLVTEKILPELPIGTVVQLEKIVRGEIMTYYEMNTIKGCTKMGSPNFSFSANVDDGSCTKKATNMTFGGVYQKCTPSGNYHQTDPCKDLNQVNPQTGGYSCPHGYEAVKLVTETRHSSETERNCHRCWIFAHCCHTDTLQSSGTYTAYWCSASQSVSQGSGYLFGGLYTKILENPVTKAHTCPPNYYALRLLTDFHVCVSDDFELTAGDSLPLGGFFTCHSGNPLASGKLQPVSLEGSEGATRLPSLATFMAANMAEFNKKCPEGYSQHLAVTTLSGCAIHYCIRTGVLSGPLTPPVKRPPYVDPPSPPQAADDNLVMFDVTAQTWLKDEKAREYQAVMMTKLNVATPEEAEKKLRGKDGGSTTAELSAGAAAGISVVATLACVAMATFIIVAVSRRRNRKQRSYRSLAEEPSGGNYGTSSADRSEVPEAIISQQS